MSTQLNLGSIGVRNYWKFALNSSLIQIRIPTCASFSILGIIFGSDMYCGFKLGRKANSKGYNFIVYQNSK